jgi:hypothetical protein
MVNESSHPGPAHEILPGENPLVPTVRRVVYIISTLLILFYGFLQWRNLPVVPILNAGDPYIVLQIVLFFLFFSWVTGINMDVSTQAGVYIHTRGGYSIAKSAVAAVLIHFVSALILLWARKSTHAFAFAITLFSFASIGLMMVSNKTVRPVIDKSREIYLRIGDNFGAEQTRVLEKYLLGNWVWIRVAVLLILLICVDLTCFSAATDTFLLKLISDRFGEHVAFALHPWLCLLSIIAFLAIAEIWQWVNRLEASSTVRALAFLRDSYEQPRRLPHQ